MNCVIVLKYPRLQAVAATGCAFCNAIGGSKFLTEKQSNLMKPEKSAKITRLYFFPREKVWSGHDTNGNGATL